MEHKWLNRSVETAQRRVEQQHFAVRKRTLEYDDVMNKQRSVVYEIRSRVLNGDQEAVHNLVLDVMNDLVQTQAERCLFDTKGEGLADFMDWLGHTFPVTVTEEELTPLLGKPAEAGDLVMKRVAEAYESKCAGEDPEMLPQMERGVFLSVVDSEWQEYLSAMDDLRQGVNLRAYGQRDPLIEYKKEAFEMFETLMATVKSKVVLAEFRSASAARMRAMLDAMAASNRARTNAGEFDSDAAVGGSATPRRSARCPAAAGPGQKTIGDVFAEMMAQGGGAPQPGSVPPPGFAPAPVRRASAAVGRNDPCPCGSGKKYKKCCGRGLA